MKKVVRRTSSKQCYFFSEMIYFPLTESMLGFCLHSFKVIISSIEMLNIVISQFYTVHLKCNEFIEVKVLGRGGVKMAV